MKKFTFLFVALVASAAMFAQNPVITNDSLWNEFKVYFNQYYPAGSDACVGVDFPRADQPIADVATFWPSATDGSKQVDPQANILTNENSWYKWLGDFIKEVATSQGFAVDSEAQWRFNLWAFFNRSQRTSWPKSADFSTAGDPAIWNELYYAQPAKPEVPSAVENTTVAVKAQKVMIDGQVYMVREGKTFNMLGQEVK